MSLRLSPEHQKEYDQLCNINNLAKEAATARGDHAAAKRARQANSYLYQEYEAKQLPPPPPTEWEREQRMTLEERVERIEQFLKLGAWKE